MKKEAQSEIEDGSEGGNDFIDEFAPSDISIPNYNKEKEQRKRQKAGKKIKKIEEKEETSGRRAWRKVLKTACSIALFVLLLIVTTVTLSSVIVRVNTSEFAIEGAIMEYGPERLTIGKIDGYEQLGLEKSADDASVADVLRDNSKGAVTYKAIEKQVKDSSYPRFVSDIATNIVGFYLYDYEYTAVSEEQIASMLYKNSSKLNIIGQQLSENDSKKLAKYIVNSPLYKEISVQEMQKQESVESTSVTSVLFSIPVLIGMIIAFMLLIMLIVAVCKGRIHTIIGWALMIAGLLSGITGFLTEPSYKPATAFSRDVLEAITAMFNENALIYGAVVFGVGLLVLLIGGAMKDDDDDENVSSEDDDDLDEFDEDELDEYEDEYEDELDEYEEELDEYEEEK